MLELAKEHWVLTFIFGVLCLITLESCFHAICAAVGKRRP